MGGQEQYLSSVSGDYGSLMYKIGAVFQRASVEEHILILLDSRSTHGNVDTALLKESTSKPLAGLIANKEMSEVARWTRQSLPFQAISRYISLSGDFHVVSRPFAANPTLQ